MWLEERIRDFLRQLEDERRLGDKRAEQFYNLFSVEDWIAPNLLTSWVNYGGTWAPAGYCKDSFGIVHLKGLIKNGTIGEDIFILPAGYRPEDYVAFATISSDGSEILSRCTIYSDGSVKAASGGNTWFNLSGITFRIA
ncbi:hypothetical protein KA005_73805 [bacterium]|nr:hypothetical protein [bacterium]